VLTRALDRCLLHSVWLPDSKSLLVGGHDGTHTAFWQQPLEGPARRLDLGRAEPAWSYHMDAHVRPTGAIAFTGAAPDGPAELYFMESITSAPRRLTDLTREVASLKLGKVESITWLTHDKYKADGILTFPPDFSAEKKYPLVLLIHGGPSS